jgi:glycosyltransferase involved in cell wall biosynthesis
VKILYTCCQPGYAGGTGRYVQTLFEYFHNKYDVYLAVQRASSLYSDLMDRHPGKLVDADYPLKVKRLPAVIKHFHKLYKFIKREGFDIVHCNGKPDHKLITFICGFLNKRPKIIYTQHEGHRLKTDFFTKKRFNNTDHVILTCDKYGKFYTEAGVKKDDITFVPNCVDIEYFSPGRIDPQEVSRLKKMYRINAADIVFVTIGTAPYKGWHYLTQALSGLQDNKNIKVVLIGGIPEKDVIDKYVIGPGLKDNVIFAGLRQDIRNYVAMGDVGFMLSDSVESFSLALREMISMGKPVIVSDFACLPYNVDDKITGYVVPKGDTEILKELIIEIAADKKKMLEMGLKARRKAEREFNLKNFFDITEDIYIKALQSAK